MSSVKGSKEYEFKLVKHRPYVRVVAGIFMCLLLTLAVASAFKLGFKKGSADRIQVTKALSEAQAQLETLIEKELKARRTLEQTKMGAQMDRSTIEDVRQEVIELKNTIAKLEEENQFYRNLMAPTKDKSGLTFGSVELVEGDTERMFKYKVVMQQLSTKHQLLSGSLMFNIVGKQQDIPMVLALKDVSNDIDTESIRLRFKYFQNIEGTLKLPDDFDAERIDLVATSTSPDRTTVEKRFGWLVESE